MLVGSACAKFANVPGVVGPLAAVGFDGSKLIFIAVLEIGSAILYLIPITRSAGLLLLSAYLGGAIATHMGHGQSIAQPSFVLSFLWLGAWLRHPEILWSFRHSSQHREPIANQERGEASLREA